MEIWICLLLSTTMYFIGAAGAETTDNNFFTQDIYGKTYSELQKCAVPSAKMFSRGLNEKGDREPSAFDRFCYYKAAKEPLALFMCTYYKNIVEDYFKEYCDDNGPGNTPLDGSAQYTNFVSDPTAVCTYLSQAVQTSEGKFIFSSPDDCMSLCRGSVEFCGNFGFILQIVQNRTETNSDDEKQVAEKTDEVPGGIEDVPTEDKTAQQDDTDEATDDETVNNEETEKVEDKIDDQSQENTDLLEDVPTEEEQTEDDTDKDGDLPIPINSAEKDGEEEDDDNLPPEGEEEEDDDDDDGGNLILNPLEDEVGLPPGQHNNSDEVEFDFNRPGDNIPLYPDDNLDDTESSLSASDDSDAINSDDIEAVNNDDDEAAANLQPPPKLEEEDSRNILLEQERAFLEEESSSHFLAYSLTAIILVMVTYILYHNKQKIVAIIIEGRHGGQGKRRRYNQNVYTTLDETA